MELVNRLLLWTLLYVEGHAMKKSDSDEMKKMIEDIAKSFDYNHNATADCIEVIGRAVKNIGKRLEMLEDHVYNNMDEDDENYLN